MGAPRKVIIDTDPGIDDALALMLAFASPELEVLAVTVVAGNVGLERTVANAAGLVAFAGSRVPVASGCSRPLVREPLKAEHVHGEDGLGGAAELLPSPGAAISPAPAVEMILDFAGRFPGEITLITLGPMTNAATAFQLDPDRFRMLAGIVAMGGAFRVPGNVTPEAEFNIYADPHAAALVLRSGVRAVFVGLDVTRQVTLSRADVADAPEVVRRAVGFNDWTMQLHDPLAVGVAIDPTLVEASVTAIDVDLNTGATVAGEFEARVAFGVDGPRFLRLFHERVLDRAYA